MVFLFCHFYFIYYSCLGSVAGFVFVGVNVFVCSAFVMFDQLRRLAAAGATVRTVAGARVVWTPHSMTGCTCARFVLHKSDAACSPFILLCCGDRPNLALTPPPFGTRTVSDSLEIG